MNPNTHVGHDGRVSRTRSKRQDVASGDFQLTASSVPHPLSLSFRLRKAEPVPISGRVIRSVVSFLSHERHEHCDKVWSSVTATAGRVLLHRNGSFCEQGVFTSQLRAVSMKSCAGLRDKQLTHVHTFFFPISPATGKAAAGPLCMTD